MRLFSISIYSYFPPLSSLYTLYNQERKERLRECNLESTIKYRFEILLWISLRPSSSASLDTSFRRSLQWAYKIVTPERLRNLPTKDGTYQGDTGMITIKRASLPLITFETCILN